MTRSNIHLSPNRILASNGEVVLPVTLGSPTALRAIFADLPKIWASANRSLPLSRAEDSGVKASSSMIWWRASPISFRLLSVFPTRSSPLPARLRSNSTPSAVKTSEKGFSFSGDSDIHHPRVLKRNRTVMSVESSSPGLQMQTKSSK